MENNKQSKKITVWEPAIRVFHWAIVLSVLGCIVTSFEESALTLHIWFGQAILALFVFRLGWGFFGGPYAKFKDFIKGPKAAFHHLVLALKGVSPRYLGHNPAAGMMFMAMGLVLVALIGSGYLLLGGLEEIGPLAGKVSKEFAAQLEPKHRYLGWFLAFLSFGHIGAAIVESLHQSENLPLAMVTGEKEIRANEPLTSEKNKKGASLVFALAIAVFMGGVFTLFPLKDYNKETQKAASEIKHASWELYKEECGACHFEFSANLLPMRSWDKVMQMSELEEHFGDDASIEEEDRILILQFLVEQSIETSKSEVSFYLNQEIAADQQPIRFSETDWWKGKHKSIEEKIFKREKIGSKLNCGACHKAAQYGSYADRDIHIPH